MPDPAISIVISTYNWSSVLRYAVESALNQTFTDFELLVVGDGCTDDSEQVVTSFDDPRVQWHNLDRNYGGQWAPNNHGIELARGNYIAYLGHDDLWLPNHLELLLDTINQNNTDVAFSLALFFGAPGCDGRVVGGVFPDGEYVSGQHITPGAVLHKREAALALSGMPWRSPEGRQLPTDVDFLTRLHDNHSSIHSLPRVTIFKFPASWRPNCYKEKRSDEQEKYAALIKSDPQILLKELHNTAISYELLKPVSTLSFDYETLYQSPGGITNAHLTARGLTDEEPEIGEPGVILSSTLRQRIQELTQPELEKHKAASDREIVALEEELRRVRDEKNRKRDRINRLRAELDRLKRKA
ncbi:MAG: glycosyltransferase [Verrucomicrobiota bacterium]